MTDAGRILVIDDEHDIGEFVAAAASSLGLQCVVTTDAGTLPELLTPDVSLILLDLMMPEMDGVEALRLLSELKCKAGIVLMSGISSRVLETAEKLAGTLGLFVNKDALGGKAVPACWKDLLKPEYKGMVGYLDPTSAAVGYVGVIAVNNSLGGNENNFTPAIEFFKGLKKNDAIVPKQTSYARVVSGEIPILFDYDFNAYRAKYTEKGNFEFVIPCEGSVVFPYVVSLVKNAPDKEKAKKVLDYLLSDKGQAIWTNAYLRPARPIELPAAVKAKFLPDSDYARAKSVDWAKLESVQKGFTDRYLAEVH